MKESAKESAKELTFKERLENIEAIIEIHRLTMNLMLETQNKLLRDIEGTRREQATQGEALKRLAADVELVQHAAFDPDDAWRTRFMAKVSESRETSLLKTIEQLNERIADLEGDLRQRNNKPGRSFRGKMYAEIADMLDARWQHAGLSRELREEMGQIIAELRTPGRTMCYFQRQPIVKPGVKS